MITAYSMKPAAPEDVSVPSIKNPNINPATSVCVNAENKIIDCLSERWSKVGEHDFIF